jgi:hypothetical protein
MIALALIMAAALALPVASYAQSVPPPPTATLSDPTCLSGLLAIGFISNPYNTPEQEAVRAGKFLVFAQQVVNEEVDAYLANSQWKSLLALPFSMQDWVNAVVYTSRACGVPVVPPASLTS